MLSSYGSDWLKLYQGQASAVLFPKSTKDVVNIVLWARKNQVSLVPSGGRTGLSGGATVLKKEVVVSFDKMNKISEFNPVDQSVVVEAGTVTKNLQDFAKEKGLYFPVSFAAEGSSQLGGNIATNAGGVHVLKYGSTRARVLGLEVVTGQGEVLNLNRGLLKNSGGYSLMNLFIGSEGTLGFITKATVSLVQPPKNPCVFLLAVSKQEALLQLFSEFKMAFQPLAFEMFSDKALHHVLQHKNTSFPLNKRSSFYLLIELEEQDIEKACEVFEKNLENALIEDGVLSQNSAQFQEIWSFRESITEAIDRYTPYKNDLCVRISQMPSFMEEADSLLKKQYADFEVVWFGHIGDGNLHINVLKPPSLDSKEFIAHCTRVNETLFSLIKKYEGTISAEHGIGILKKPYLEYSCQKEEIVLMKKFKKILDPDLILNPGKIFDI